MDLTTFRHLVDGAPAQLPLAGNAPDELWAYAGFEPHSCYSSEQVSEALYQRIRHAFGTGSGDAGRRCRGLRTDLIREHVIRRMPLSPYIEVLDRLCDALRPTTNGLADADWPGAVLAARDSIALSGWTDPAPRRTHARDFAVAEAASALAAAGYPIQLEPGRLALTDEAEQALVTEVERLIRQAGGLNVARRIFHELTPLFDAALGRYQLVPQPSAMGGGAPQIPWGYLLQLAIKHLDGERPHHDLAPLWPRLVSLATAYAAVLDVQPYAVTAWAVYDAERLIRYLQQQALYDSTFRFQQLRPSDVANICRGALAFLDPAEPVAGDWTIDDAIAVVTYMLDPVRDARGPVIFKETVLRKALPQVAPTALRVLLHSVFSHPETGANRALRLPTDAPGADGSPGGADFFLKPLLRQPGNRFVLIDRSL